MKTIVGITGTTSVGKSSVGVALAKILQSEIVSADSMQIYKGMNIGTAKITEKEMQGVKHHMIDVVEPNVNYSSFMYQQEASKIIDNMDSIPVVVGGTGFYFDSLIYPPEFGCVDEQRRSELKRTLDLRGLDYMQLLLKKLDIDAYNSIDIYNPKRVLRAIEIAESGGKLSNGVGRTIEPKYDLKLFVLERPRGSLYEQIDLRIDDMIEAGLIDEVRNIILRYGICDTSAFKAIGYKEIIDYLGGAIGLDDAISRIKLNTRHYAKRQETYFRKMTVYKRINVENKNVLDIAESIRDCLDFHKS